MQDAAQTDPHIIKKLCRLWLCFSLPQELAISVLLCLAAGRNGQARDLQLMTIVMATALQIATQLTLLAHLLRKLLASKPPPPTPLDPPAAH